VAILKNYPFTGSYYCIIDRSHLLHHYIYVHLSDDKELCRGNTLLFANRAKLSATFSNTLYKKVEYISVDIKGESSLDDLLSLVISAMQLVLLEVLNQD